MQPLLISNIIELVSESDSESSNDRGWSLTAAVGLVYIGLAVTGGAYQHKANRMTTMVRGALVNAIYSQTLDLSITNLDESAAVTLMSSDVDRICEAILSIHNMWSSPVEIALAIWFLQQYIGVALLGPLFITAIAITGPFLISKYIGKAQMAWMERIQSRIDTTAKVLNSMKGIKFLGISSNISSIVYKLRSNEIVASLKMRKLLIVMIAFGNMSDIFAPGAAFAIYVIRASVNGQRLDVTSAFTALSLIALLVGPIRALVFTTPPLIAAIGCFDRIQAFLSLHTKRDHRMVMSESEGQQSVISRRPKSLYPMSTGLNIEPSPLPTIRANNLKLAWTEESSPVVDDISLEFQPGNLTMIVGPIGCGKSSLIQGLLGETPSTKGNVYIDRAHAAYVGQVPWIQNSSIRDNIVGFSVFEPVWYATVVHACALDSDIEALPEGDSSKTGSGGGALSGGQKLRIVRFTNILRTKHN